MKRRSTAAARQVSPALPQYPQLWANVNAPPLLVHQPDQAQQLGNAWKKIDLRPFLPDVPSVWLDPTSAQEPATAGSGSFTVTITNPGISGVWTVEQDASATWLTVTAPAGPQSVDGDVEYLFAPNAGAERTARIYVNGKTFTITQAGA